MSSLICNELPITGYVDRFSRRPGEPLRVHVSVRDGGKYRMRLVRVLSADANPDGPGLRFEDLAKYLDETREGQCYPIHPGSYCRAPAPKLKVSSHTWTALVQTSRVSQEPQAVLSHESEGRRLTLLVMHGAVRAEVTTSNSEGRCELASPVHPHQWYRVWASADEKTGELLVGLQPVDRAAGKVAIHRMSVPGLRPPTGGEFLIAASGAEAPRQHFDGRIEDPAIVEGVRDRWIDPLISLSQLANDLRAGWDFSVGISSQSITDVGPEELDGVLNNIPTRAVRGARWSGEVMNWSDRPKEYAAIHFHSDDLGDCGWPVAFEFTIPSGLRSGAYALHLACEAGEDRVPFYVLPPRKGPHARIAFVAPTFTYQAYANIPYRSLDEQGFRERVRSWGCYPHHPQDHPIYGLSTYQKHRDGSGVAFSSRLRPILNMRPGYVSFFESKGSGLLMYSADSHLLTWLESHQLEFDVVTDEDLHDEGAALLAPYAVVLTGTHPEYHTADSLDALSGYLQSGGRLAYLGGNGFYWRVGCNESLPGVIEIRRAEGGIRAWAAEPGEYYHATDGGYGGLWRRNRRDPQQLVGVGFSVQGPFDGTYFRRTPESFDPRYAWIFEGVEGEIIGDYGLSGGAAAGYELDRADAALGTPPDAVVVARSENLPESFQLALEDVLHFSLDSNRTAFTVNDEPPASLLRGDMVYFETPAGGAVFSASSITFCGSLWRNGFEGPVSQLLENVVRKFASGRQ